MREYARVSPKFWTGATGRQLRQLGPECQVVALYLLTSPHANMIGLYYLPGAFIAHETGLSLGKVEAVMGKLVGAGFCAYDDEAEVVWVCEMAKYQIGELTRNHKQAIGAASLYSAAPECTHLRAFHTRYNAYLPLDEARGEATDSLSIAYPLPIDAARKPIDLERLQGATARSDEQGIAPSASDSLALVPASPVALAAPELALTLNDGSGYPIALADLDEWRRLFPAVDVEQSLRAMRAWCGANPSKRKTARGVKAFIVRWLQNDQDKGGPRGRDAPNGHLSRKGQDIAKALANSDPNMFIFEGAARGV